jgi:molecular chaperone DnaJ
MVRLYGLGMPRLRDDKRGDLMVQLVVRTPKKMTKRQRELLEEFAAEGDQAAAPEPQEGMEGLEGERARAGKKKKRRWLG